MSQESCWYQLVFDLLQNVLLIRNLLSLGSYFHLAEYSQISYPDELSLALNLHGGKGALWQFLL